MGDLADLSSHALKYSPYRSSCAQQDRQRWFGEGMVSLGRGNLNVAAVKLLSSRVRIWFWILEHSRDEWRYFLREKHRHNRIPAVSTDWFRTLNQCYLFVFRPPPIQEMLLQGSTTSGMPSRSGTSTSIVSSSQYQADSQTTVTRTTITYSSGDTTSSNAPTSDVKPETTPKNVPKMVSTTL